MRLVTGFRVAQVLRSLFVRLPHEVTVPGAFNGDFSVGLQLVVPLLKCTWWRWLRYVPYRGLFRWLRPRYVYTVIV